MAPPSKRDVDELGNLAFASLRTSLGDTDMTDRDTIDLYRSETHFFAQLVLRFLPYPVAYDGLMDYQYPPQLSRGICVNINRSDLGRWGLITLARDHAGHLCHYVIHPVIGQPPDIRHELRVEGPGRYSIPRHIHHQALGLPSLDQTKAAVTIAIEVKNLTGANPLY